ncbi:MAG TPA: FliM/FliN family flagellar motor C-terminal domain-containing protein [Candidatus Acidoferrum sp.]|jgi:flagellar motor switch/type III secretory pathway protein FliN
MATVHGPVQQIPIAVGEEEWDEAGWLPCQISVDVPVGHFTVRDLLQLEVGSVLETRSADGADVPVKVNGQLIGWSEFEIVGQRLAIRMTELG